MQGWFIVIIAIAYVTLLFAIASFGDRLGDDAGLGRPRPYIYALSLAIYCTSWTFFGSVGLASERGLEFLASISARCWCSCSAFRCSGASSGWPRPRRSPRSPTSSARATARALPSR